MVMAYGVMYAYAVNKTSGEYKAPFNHIYNEHRVLTPKDTTVVTPNSDTPYSFVWMDLRAEPMVLCVPQVEKNRYYSVQLTDMYTFNYGYIGSRATGNAAGCYMVAGPDWKGELPQGIKKIFHTATQYALALYRTQLFNSGDMPNVIKIQDGYRAETLSSFLNQAPPPPQRGVFFPSFTKEEAQQNFPKYLNFVLQFCPPPPEEEEMRTNLETVGIGPGLPFDPEKLSAPEKAGLAEAEKEGYEEIQKNVDNLGKNVNGWIIGSGFGDRNFFHGDWLKRASAAMAGIFGNNPAEATYPLARQDNAGAPLDGSKHNYTVTFPAGQLPPVNAFWSITMYDGKTQLLIANPINRYLINSPMLPGLVKNKDGSLTIYIQKNAPAGDKKANWLPSPDGPIYMVMRLYWPKPEPPSILPPGDGTWKPPAVTAAD